MVSNRLHVIRSGPGTARAQTPKTLEGGVHEKSGEKGGKGGKLEMRRTGEGDFSPKGGRWPMGAKKEGVQEWPMRKSLQIM